MKKHDDMQWYPLCLTIRQRPCLVVGGGSVAFAKARTLHRAGAVLTVVAPAITDGFVDLKDVRLQRRPFQAADLDGMFLAIAATNQAEVNGTVARACAERNILCCVVDQPEAGDFIVPAIIERGDFMIMVASGGHAPALSRRIRRELDDWFPADFEAYVAFLGEARRRSQAYIADAKARKELATWLASPAGYDAFAQTPAEGRNAWIEALLHEKEEDTPR